jgi:hypothetical protein
MLEFLDLLLLGLHLVLIGFNLTGWIWKRTRPIHLVLMILTMVSWVGLGICYGFGYCFLTDWHWQVKRKLGETEIPSSFFKYHLDRLTGFEWDPGLVDGVVVGLTLFVLVASILLNVRDWRRRRTAAT